MVERNLAKVEVASSRLVSRSTFPGENGQYIFPFQFLNLRSTTPQGGVAEWSCSGLQSRLRRFDSDPRLHISLSRVGNEFFCHQCGVNRRACRDPIHVG